MTPSPSTAPMRAFVTGATGLLGSNLVELLLGEGHSVTALVRSPEKAGRLFKGKQPTRLVVGDMTQVDAFADQLAGHDVLFHTAAYFREFFQPGDHAGQLVKVNVEGALRLFEAAKARGVKKIVHVSTIGVLSGSEAAPGDERSAPSIESERNGYFRSKLDCERALTQRAAELRLPLMAVLPGLMYGPRDSGPTSTGQFVLDCLARRVPVGMGGGVSTVDARDVAAAMVAAARVGVLGRRYVVGGRFVTTREVFTTIGKLAGVAVPRVFVPDWAARAMARGCDLYALLSGGRTLLSYEGVRVLQSRLAVTSEVAIRELGLTFRPFEETIRDTIEWYVAEGLASLPRSLSPRVEVASHRGDVGP